MPQFVEYFGPVLRALDALGGSGRPREVADKVAEMLHLTPEQLQDAAPGKEPRFANRVAWARFYLVKAGFIDSSVRGVWQLTDVGRERLTLDAGTANSIFQSVHSQFGKADAVIDETQDELDPPTEQSDPAGLTPALDYRADLLGRPGSMSPGGFERFCQRLLREAGFQTVEVTGRANDGGIDGIGVLEVNALVSFKVLFQCKRYQGSVAPSQVRNFRGAMAGRADKGIILTTGTFTAEARKEAVRDGVPPIELVDGDKLVAMCQSLGLGLKEVRSFAVDPPFFEAFV